MFDIICFFLFCLIYHSDILQFLSGENRIFPGMAGAVGDCAIGNRQMQETEIDSEMLTNIIAK